MEAVPDVRRDVEKDGFAIIRNLLSPPAVTDLLTSLERIDETGSVRRRGGVFAIRNLLEVSPEVRELANSEAVRQRVEAVLGDGFFPVRGILFDKIPEANWKVPWHQDLTIAVRERIPAAGFHAWSMKADVLHVQPPAEILEHMLSVRIHLDDCAEQNGALRVIPGSHLHGRIPEEKIRAMRDIGEVVCQVSVGGALLMRPLLLHASSASTVPGHRRVVHLDFASLRLPNGMRWFSESAQVRQA